MSHQLNHKFIVFCSAIMFSTFYSRAASAATETVNPTLLIGTHERVGYREKNANGKWSGIDIRLIEAIFEQLPFNYEFVELPWQRTLK